MSEPFIAPDAEPVIRAFREAGGRSFQDAGVEQARLDYRASCARNGVPPEDVAIVADSTVPSPEGPVPVRWYDPRGDAAVTGAILFLHGGGWVIGDLETHDRLCRYLAARTGLPVLAVDYRLAPEHPYPAAIDDARAALRALLATADERRIDPRRVAVVGDSAGGQLAAVLAIESASGRFAHAARAQVLLYPVTDLAAESEGYRRIASGVPLTGASMRWFASHYVPEGVDRRRLDLSPLRTALPRHGPDAFVVTVDLDPLGVEGARYAAALARAGTEVEHHHLAGYAHGLFTSAGIIPRGRAMLDRAVGFLRERLA